jgi:hypothetical protein
MPNKLNMTPKKEKHPKPRSYQAGDKDKFDFGYTGIDWSKKTTDPNAPVCPVCDGKAPAGTCPGCV